MSLSTPGAAPEEAKYSNYVQYSGVLGGTYWLWLKLLYPSTQPWVGLTLGQVHL